MKSLLVLLCLIISFLSCIYSQCESGPGSALYNDRISVGRTWTLRINNQSEFERLYAIYPTDDFCYSPAGNFGSFCPLINALAYHRLLFQPLPQFGNHLITEVKIALIKGSERFIEPDVLRIDYITNASILFNVTTNSYVYIVEGLPYADVMHFENCSTRIKSEVLIAPTLGDHLYTAALAAPLPSDLCFALIGSPPGFIGACPVNTSFQIFTDYNTCLEKYNLLPYKTDCPFALESDTLTCRSIHVASAFELPFIHCPHCARKGHSVPCNDTCLQYCVNCSSNAHCDGVISSTDASVTYACKCNNGYTGDGHTCTINSCSTPADCASGDSRGTCINNTCGCINTFIWDPSSAAKVGNSQCFCNFTSKMVWNGHGKESVPECIPTGSCRAATADDEFSKDCRKLFPFDKEKTFTCVKYGHNDFDPYFKCICNPGYDGGWQVKCVCPEGKTERISINLDGDKACLAPGECVDDEHCSSHHCIRDPSINQIGFCA